MISEHQVICPYCFESIWIEFYFEDGEQQEMVIDCEVCCRPNLYQFDCSDINNPKVTVDRS